MSEATFSSCHNEKNNNNNDPNRITIASSPAIAPIFAAATPTILVPQSPASSSVHSSPWIRKPLSVVRQQEAITAHPEEHQHSSSSSELHRHLSLWDLILLGVGGTVGGGIFVLTGQIAAAYSGKACFISFIIAGSAAALSGSCYAELAARIPAAGSTYVYAYVCLGEQLAVLAAACLTLEYGIAGAAVARTWGDKVRNMQYQHVVASSSASSSWIFNPNSNVNVPACLVSAASTLILLAGVRESKAIMNWTTLLKLIIITIMVVGGFFLYDVDVTRNEPWAPMGVGGVLRGATTSFFAYIGYDEVCCMAGEAQHPRRDMPRAVLGTLGIVTACYVLASIALTGMVPYEDISPTAGFPDAFRHRGRNFVAKITAAGEVVTLPVVVLISLLAQPRLTLSMAVDGLLPEMFSNLQKGSLVSGTLMTIIATFVPFTYLDDLISAGILVAFSMTNCCLVLLRCQSPDNHVHGNLLEILLAIYNGLCFLTAMLWTHASYLPWQNFCAVVSTLATVACLINIAISCPKTKHFGGSILREGEYSHDPHINRENEDEEVDGPVTDESEYYRTPAVPYLPCLGMAVNWYLIAQLDRTGILLLCLYLGFTTLLYRWGCAPRSIGHLHQWGGAQNFGVYATVDSRMSRFPERSATGNHEEQDYEESELHEIQPDEPMKRIRTNSM
jgi:APA family basic amino acid/polyamine antiporter